MSSVPRVLVVYPYLHHYRRGVFSELDNSSAAEFTFAADTEGRLGINAMPASAVKRFARLKTRRWRGVEYQVGAVGLMKPSEFDIVVFLGDASSISTWIAAAVARMRGIKVLFWTIGWHRPEHGLKRVIRFSFYRLSNMLMLYGNVAREIGISLGYPEDRMRVIGNSTTPLDVHEFSMSDALPAVASNQIWSGAVARLTDAKRFELLIEATSILRDSGYDARVLLVGEGPSQQSLKNLAVAKGVPLSIHPPVYDRETLGAVYERLTVTVVPSAAGLTTVQSLQFGVPVVSDDDAYSQMPEWEAIIDRKTGGLYRKDDTQSLAERIVEVASMIRDDPREVREACEREYAARWSPDVHASRVLTVLGELQ